MELLQSVRENDKVFCFSSLKRIFEVRNNLFPVPEFIAILLLLNEYYVGKWAGFLVNNELEGVWKEMS